MYTINLQKLNDETFEVTVSDSTSTMHTVSLQPHYAEKLTGGRLSAEQLVLRSFEFLLERESNSSILRRFDLAVIGQYFPEYEASMRRLDAQ